MSHTTAPKKTAVFKRHGVDWAIKPDPVELPPRLGEESVSEPRGKVICALWRKEVVRFGAAESDSGRFFCLSRPPVKRRPN